MPLAITSESERDKCHEEDLRIRRIRHSAERLRIKRFIIDVIVGDHADARIIFWRLLDDDDVRSFTAKTGQRDDLNFCKRRVRNRGERRRRKGDDDNAGDVDVGTRTCVSR